MTEQNDSAFDRAAATIVRTNSGSSAARYCDPSSSSQQRQGTRTTTLLSPFSPQLQRRKRPLSSRQQYEKNVSLIPCRRVSVMVLINNDDQGNANSGVGWDYCLFPVQSADHPQTISSRDLIVVNPNVFRQQQNETSNSNFTLETARLVAQCAHISSEDWIRTYRFHHVGWPQSVLREFATPTPVAQEDDNAYLDETLLQACRAAVGDIMAIGSIDTSRNFLHLGGFTRKRSLLFGEQDCLIKIALEQILQELPQQNAKCTLSILEVNEHDAVLYDLLANRPFRPGNQVALRYPSGGSRQHCNGPIVSGAKESIVDSMETLGKLLGRAMTVANHSQRKTPRGSIVASVKVWHATSDSQESFNSIQFVDVLLESREDFQLDTTFTIGGRHHRVSTENADHRRYQAASRKAVSTLGGVLRGLLLKEAGSESTFSYRDSLLTKLLQRNMDSKDSRTVVLASVSPYHYDDSMATLRYVSRLIHKVGQTPQSPFDDNALSGSAAAISPRSLATSTNSFTAAEPSPRHAAMAPTSPEAKAFLLRQMICDPRQRLAKVYNPTKPSSSPRVNSADEMGDYVPTMYSPPNQKKSLNSKHQHDSPENEHSPVAGKYSSDDYGVKEHQAATKHTDHVRNRSLQDATPLHDRFGQNGLQGNDHLFSQDQQMPSPIIKDEIPLHQKKPPRYEKTKGSVAARHDSTGQHVAVTVYEVGNEQQYTTMMRTVESTSPLTTETMELLQYNGSPLYDVQDKPSAADRRYQCSNDDNFQSLADGAAEFSDFEYEDGIPHSTVGAQNSHQEDWLKYRYDHTQLTKQGRKLSEDLDDAVDVDHLDNSFTLDRMAQRISQNQSRGTPQKLQNRHLMADLEATHTEVNTELDYIVPGPGLDGLISNRKGLKAAESSEMGEMDQLSLELQQRANLDHVDTPRRQKAMDDLSIELLRPSNAPGADGDIVAGEETSKRPSQIESVFGPRAPSIDPQVLPAIVDVTTASGEHSKQEKTLRNEGETEDTSATRTTSVLDEDEHSLLKKVHEALQSDGDTTPEQDLMVLAAIVDHMKTSSDFLLTRSAAAVANLYEFVNDRSGSFKDKWDENYRRLKEEASLARQELDQKDAVLEKAMHDLASAEEERVKAYEIADEAVSMQEEMAQRLQELKEAHALHFGKSVAEDEFLSLKSKMELLEKKLKAAQQEIIVYKNEIASSDQRLEALEDDLERERRRNIKLDSENARIHEEMDVLRRNTTESQRSEAEVSAYRREVERLRIEANETSAKYSKEREKLFQEIEEKDLELDGLTSKLQNLQLELSKLDETRKQENSAKQDENERLQGLLVHARNDTANAFDDLAEAKRRLQTVQDDKDDISAELHSTRQELDKRLSDVKELTVNLRRVLKEKTDAEEENRKMKAALDDFRVETRSKVQNLVREQQAAKELLESTLEENAAHAKTIDELKQVLENLREERDVIMAQLKDGRAALNDLEREYSKDNSSNSLRPGGNTHSSFIQNWRLGGESNVFLLDQVFALQERNKWLHDELARVRRELSRDRDESFLHRRRNMYDSEISLGHLRDSSFSSCRAEEIAAYVASSVMNAVGRSKNDADSGSVERKVFDLEDTAVSIDARLRRLERQSGR